MNINSAITKKSLKKIEKITGAQLTLGKLIWSIRESVDMTQIEFAKKLNISNQHLCDLEHDRKTVSPKLAANYAKKLGYSEEQFVRLALQGILDREGLNFTIEINTRSKSIRSHGNKQFAYA